MQSNSGTLARVPYIQHVAALFSNVLTCCGFARVPAQYPTMYVSETDKERQIFNCYQRTRGPLPHPPGPLPNPLTLLPLALLYATGSHQNYLEQIATFISVLAMGSVFYPTAAAALGTVYLLGRVFYARGYQTGDPKKRGQGSFGYVGLIGLLGLSVHALLKIGQVL